MRKPGGHCDSEALASFWHHAKRRYGLPGVLSPPAIKLRALEVQPRAAAAYLGLSIHALHRLSAERRIPASQERPGARLYFRRDELDRWRSERAR